MDAGYLWKNTENMMTVIASVISGRGNWVHEVRSGNKTYFSLHLLYYYWKLATSVREKLSQTSYMEKRSVNQQWEPLIL